LFIEQAIGVLKVLKFAISQVERKHKTQPQLVFCR
jgi:hypothetical protein